MQLLIEIQRYGLALPARRSPSHPSGQVSSKVNQVHSGLWLGYPQRLEPIGNTNGRDRLGAKPAQRRCHFDRRLPGAVVVTRFKPPAGVLACVNRLSAADAVEANRAGRLLPLAVGGNDRRAAIVELHQQVQPQARRGAPGGLLQLEQVGCLQAVKPVAQHNAQRVLAGLDQAAHVIS